MRNPRDRLNALLERLAHDLDPTLDRKIGELHRAALEARRVPRLPVVVSCLEPLPEELQPYPMADSFRDAHKMLFNELVSAWGTSIVRRREINDDLPTTVRANFGTILVASCFGAQVEIRGDDPPWARHLESREAFVRALDTTEPLGGVDGPTSEYVERAAEFMAAYREILAPYENLRDVVVVTLPDLQGPLDSAAMVRGSELFLDAAADPELFARALGRTADVQIALWRRFRALVAGEADGFVHQHGVLVAGNILIRDDSSVMISPQMYADLVAPSVARVLEAVGGGAIHSCGSIDHLFPQLLAHQRLKSVDYGQSWLNDVDGQSAAARRRGVALTRVRGSREELQSGTILDRFPTGVILTYDAPTVADAAETMRAYRVAAARRDA